MYGVALLAFGSTFVLSLVLTFLMRAWSRRSGFVDRPAGHKQHEKPIALGGGVAITASILLPIVGGTLFGYYLHKHGTADWLPATIQTHLSGISSKLSSVLAIAGGALVLHITGLIDDRKALGPGVKFIVQFLVAIFIAGPVGIRIVEFLGVPISITVTVLWIVLITNAFNFLDNMDGLSAGVAAVASMIFALAALGVGQIFVPTLALVISGAMVGYLAFNFQPASIFMGDAGSLVIGYFMAVVTILTTFYDPRQGLTPLGVFVPIVVLAVPLYDVTSVVIHRLRMGDSPLKGDRRHFSHRLVRRGMSVRKAVGTIYLATAATGAGAVALPRVEWAQATLLLVQCVCVVSMIAILEHSGVDLDLKRRN